MTLVVIGLAFVGMAFYWTIPVMRGGQTIGQCIAGVRVIAASERAPSPRRVWLRGLLQPIRPSGLSCVLRKRCRGAQESEQRRIRATGIGAQPNKRLKLAAPVVTGCRDAFPFRWCRILVVNILIRRRSLSAIR